VLLERRIALASYGEGKGPEKGQDEMGSLGRMCQTLDSFSKPIEGYAAEKHQGGRGSSRLERQKKVVHAWMREVDLTAGARKEVLVLPGKEENITEKGPSEAARNKNNVQGYNTMDKGGAREVQGGRKKGKNQLEECRSANFKSTNKGRFIMDLFLADYRKEGQSSAKNEGRHYSE